MIGAGSAGAVLVSLVAIMAKVNTFGKKSRACQGISPNTQRLSDNVNRTMIWGEVKPRAESTVIVDGNFLVIEPAPSRKIEVSRLSCGRSASRHCQVIKKSGASWRTVLAG